ncbi:hypothetical protein K2Z84_08110 [Candidatus Binatia bacterium]|nr:hypothetical protein [Candidatus Binatia bacterium]
MWRRFSTFMVVLLLTTSGAAAGQDQLPAASDHAALAAMYTSEAATLRGKAAEHELMLQRYENASIPAKGAPFPKAALVQHCRKLVATYRQAASDAQTMAQLERELAGTATPAR